IRVRHQRLEDDLFAVVADRGGVAVVPQLGAGGGDAGAVGPSGLPVPYVDVRAPRGPPGDQRRRLGNEGDEVPVGADRRRAALDAAGGATGGDADQLGRPGAQVPRVHVLRVV